MNKFNRRQLLGSSASLASMSLLGSNSLSAATRSSSDPKRLIIVHQGGLGMYKDSFWPKDFGRQYKATEMLKIIDAHRNDFTLFNKIDQNLPSHHPSTPFVLSGILREHAASSPDSGISLDARAAEHFSTATRFPMLSFWHGGNGSSISWTRSGHINAIYKPIDAYNMLFKAYSDQERDQAHKNLKADQGALNLLRKSYSNFKESLAKADQTKGAEYLNSIKSLDFKLKTSEEWLAKPKPVGDPTLAARLQSLNHIDPVQAYQAWIDLSVLALKTDSSRVITINIEANKSWQSLPGINKAYHDLSHHGYDENKLKQLLTIERFHMEKLNNLLNQLKTTKDSQGKRLLDSTMVLWLSGMGDGASHSCKDLPVILAGGGYKHGQHLNINNEQPLNNLFLSILQNLGVQTDYFNNSTGPLKGLV